MPLTEECKDYIGRKLIVVPYYGYGWGRPDLGGPCPDPRDSIGPSQFHVCLDELAYCLNTIMGGGGIIVEPNHQFDNHWCGFYLRNPDQCNFTTQLGDYMVWISQTKLQVQPAPDKALYEWVSFNRASPCLCGYGQVTESVVFMGEFYNRIIQARKEELSEGS